MMHDIVRRYQHQPTSCDNRASEHLPHLPAAVVDDPQKGMSQPTVQLFFVSKFTTYAI